MLNRTHALTGVSGWLILATIFHEHINPGVAVAGAALACLTAQVPDIDHPESKPGRILNSIAPNMSELIEQRFGHRGITHRILTAITAGGIASLCLYALSPSLWWLGLAIGIGWIIHILGDCLTHSGVMMFAPFSKVVVRPPYGWRLKTGGDFEMLVLRPTVTILVIVSAASYFYSLMT